MLFKLAQRNIWRNKRRTFITAASILFAVFFAIVTKSFHKGIWDHTVDSVVKYYFGYAQIHAKGYWEEQTINKAFLYPVPALEQIAQREDVINLVPRIENFAMASYETLSRGVLVAGIDPILENQLTDVASRLTSGTFLSENDQAVLISEGVAEYLHLALGDTLVLISQGFHGVNAAGKYPVKGLLHFASPELNSRVVQLPLKEAQWFFGAEGLVTTLVIDTHRPAQIEATVQQLATQLDSTQYEVMDYKQLLPDLIKARELDEAGSVIILAVLYLLISFGLFGTMVMMLKEREYEFGVMKAIGTKNGQLRWMIWLETILLGMVGVVAGMMVAFPLVWYMKVHPITLTGEMAAAYEKFGMSPILPTALEPSLFIGEAFTIFVIITVLSIYPLVKLGKLSPSKAMRH